MKKIGIVTITDNNNYGNRLQNYAVQQILVKLGFDVSTIWDEGKKNLKSILKICIKKLFPIKYKWNRQINFYSFTKKNIKKLNSKYNKELLNKFDYIVIGSDQIWNLKWQLNRNEFLIGCNKKNVIAFAPSFGVNAIIETQREYYEKIISDIPFLSVREYRGKEIIKDITGRDDVQVLLDPTMVLDCNEWEKIEKKPKGMHKGERYILNYFLGEVSEDRYEEIRRVAKENDCKIINIMKTDDRFYSSGPGEFLYLEKNAFLICTDSFHSSVFAILYNRPFIIFDREDKKEDNMSSRIDTLINKLGLKNREYTGKITSDNLHHDYSSTYKIMESERKKSIEFLKNALLG